jgi:hypothetical protein
MKTQRTATTYWLIAFSVGLSLVVLIKGCQQDRSPAGPVSRSQGLTLKLDEQPEIRAKVTGLTVTAEGLDTQGNLTGDTVTQNISAPRFPLDVPIVLHDPPCRWRVTVTVDLVRDLPRMARGEMDGGAGELSGGDHRSG